MLTRTALTLLILAAPALAADPPLPEGAIARLGSPHWRNLTDGNINSLIAFSPNGKSVITQGYGAVHVVDFDSGVECWRVDGIRSELSLALAPGNRLILCERNSLRTYDLETGKKLREIPRPAQNCGHLATDGKQLVFQDLYGKAPMAAVSLDLESGQQRWQYDGARSDLCYPVAFIPGRSELALRVYRHPDTILRIIDPNTLRVLREWKLPANSDVGRINPAVLSPDGKLICTGGDKLVRFWDVATGKEHSVLSGHMDAVVQVAFSGDGKRLVTSGRDLTLRWWDLPSGKELGKIKCDKLPYALAVSPDGTRVAAACAGSNALHRFDLKARREIKLDDGHTSLIEQLAFVPNGSKLLSAGRDGSVMVWDLASRKTVRSWRPDHRSLNFLAVSADGKLAATAGYNDSAVRIWQIASGKEQGLITLNGPTTGALAFAPDGTTLAVGLFTGVPSGGTIHFFEARTGKESRRFAGHPNGVGSLSFTTDGEQLASTASDVGLRFAVNGGSPAQLLNLAKEKVLTTGGEVDRDVIISPNGREAALNRVSMPGCRTKLIELASGQVRAEFEQEGTYIGSLAFSPDGRLLVTQGSFQKTRGTREPGVFIFSPATGKLLRRVDAGQIWSLVFSPDGRTLATGGMDGTILLWDVSQIHDTFPSGRLDADKLWPDLLADAPRAYQAIVAIGAGSEEGVKLLRERLKPATPLDQKQVTKLLDDLESPQFAIRQKAAGQLAGFDERVAGALRDRLKTTPSAEARKTISRLLEQLNGWLTQPQVLREVRAVEAMERNYSPAARQLLEDWAKGDPKARLTREAKAGLKQKLRMAAMGRK